MRRGTSFLLLLLFFLPSGLLLPLSGGCSRREGGKAGVEALLGFGEGPAPLPAALDWAADPLWKKGGVALRRPAFEAYLCERFARDWTRTRAVLALFAQGRYPGLERKIRIPEKDVLRLRAGLAERVSRGDEGLLRKALLARGWGEVGLLDRLRGRLLADRLAAIPREERAALPEGARKLLAGPLPPLLPDSLEGLAGDVRARIVRELAEGRVSYFLERRLGGGEILAWAGREPLVRTEEILVDLLGVLTGTERRRALREYTALRVAEERLGRICRAAPGAAPGGEGPARAWMERVRAAFLASREGRSGSSLLSRAARKAASRRIRGGFLLIPALRKSSGRPGFAGDQRRARARARAWEKRLARGDSPQAVRREILEGLPQGPAAERARAVMALSGRLVGPEELEAALATPLDGLGLGENPAWSLLLFGREGEWILVSTWWGPLLFGLQEEEEVPEKAAAPLASDLEGRMRFFAWCRKLLGE